MKTRTRVILAVLLMMFVVLVGQSSAQEMGRYIVHTTGDTAVNEAARQDVEARAGLTLKELPTRTGLVVIIPDVAVGPIAGIPGVVAVEPDVVLTAVQSEEVPWGVDRIDADLAWGTVTGSGVNIAIIDTGIDKDHPDLTVTGGRNFVRKGRRVDPEAWDDDNGHGTHCAGIAAALDNEIGVIGVAPGASLIAVKVLDRSGSGYLSDIMDGIYWAADNADVINLSLGIEKEILDQYPYDKQLLKDALDYAYLTQGVVVVAAAGNEYPGEDTVIYPARFESAIAVSATDSYDNLASFSSTGPDVELSAPGVGIYSTIPGGYGTKSGTSMAAPHVAGTSALVIAANIGGVRTQLQDSAEDLGTTGPDDLYGHGLVDAAAAAGVSEGPVTDIAITEIIAPSSVVQGDLVDVSVTVENVGNQNVSNITVTLSSNLGGVIGQQTIDLTAGDSITLIFSWDTNEAALEDHLLGAIHNCADDENSDNDYQETTVAVQSALTDIAITAVSAPGSVVEGTQVNVEVTVENIGNQNVSSDIIVSLNVDTYDVDIGTKTISGGLAAGAYATLTFNWDTSGASLDEHTLIASHDFIDGDPDNDSLSTTVTVTEAGDEMFMHVESIVIELLDRTAGRNTFTKALATVTIFDASDDPVEGATVYGHWSGATSDSDSGVTNSSGEVTLESDAVKNAGGTEFIFTVDDVVKSGWTYTP